MLHGLSQGRIVQYVLAPEDVDAVYVAKNPLPEGRAVCAMIVKVVDEETGLVNLTLFPDWSNDGFLSRGSAVPQPVGIAWKQGVSHSDEKTPGTWHFPAIPTLAIRATTAAFTSPGQTTVTINKPLAKPDEWTAGEPQYAENVPAIASPTLDAGSKAEV